MIAWYWLKSFSNMLFIQLKIHFQFSLTPRGNTSGEQNCILGWIILAQKTKHGFTSRLKMKSISGHNLVLFSAGHNLRTKLCAEKLHLRTNISASFFWAILKPKKPLVGFGWIIGWINISLTSFSRAQLSIFQFVFGQIISGSMSKSAVRRRTFSIAAIRTAVKAISWTEDS